MISDNERREVARRLRGDPCDTLIPYRTGVHFGMGCHEAANRFWDMCDRIKTAGDYDIAWSTCSVLADLIEPSEPKVRCVAEVKVDGERLEKLAHDAAAELTGIDRDALLEVAETLEDCAVRGSDLTALGYSCLAKRIREALGVSDG